MLLCINLVTFLLFFTEMTSIHPLEEILHPKSIAVTGSSPHPASWGYNYTRFLLDYGFKGEIYPVNPKYHKILGLKAYPSLGEVPGPVDYVISCVPAGQVLQMLDEASGKGVKGIHLFTARFSETGRPGGAELEQEILKCARKLGIRLIGPNGMGVYYPRHGMAFGADLPKESGPVALASQSGGGAVEIVRLASIRGICFSKAITYGNAIDFNECDYLDYFFQDAETKIIMLYIEGVRDGRRFFNTLRKITPTKPVIITKGGRGESGRRAARSHTASLTSSTRVWQAAVAQAGALSAANFEEMADLATTFYFLPPIPGPRVGITGGGGGAGVLAADQCEEAGLDVIPLPDDIRQELKSRGVPTWDWIGNPTDMSIREDDKFGIGDMLKLMAENPNFDLLITMTGAPLRRGQSAISAKEHVEQFKLNGENRKALLAVVAERGVGIDDYDNLSWRLTAEVRTELIAAGIPFYPSIGRAARAARKVIDYYRKMENL